MDSSPSSAPCQTPPMTMDDISLGSAYDTQDPTIMESPRQELAYDEYGYVYVLLGDITKLCCDYYLAPTGSRFRPTTAADFPKNTQRVEVVPEKSTWEKCNYMGPLYTFEPWPTHMPKPYIVALNKERGVTAKYINEIARFLREAAKENAHRSKLRKCKAPLLVTPLLGTGYGGNYQRTGDMIKSLLPVVYDLAQEWRIDIGIVTIEEEVYSLIQSCKLNFIKRSEDQVLQATVHGNRYLPQAVMNKIPFLTHQALCGELTLFVGAGASIGAGLPSWSELLSLIAQKVGLTGALLDEFATLDYYTKADVLERRIKKLQRQNSETKSLGQMIADATTLGRYSVTHALVAALPVTEIITTNYDDLLEKAWELSGNFSVLPYNPQSNCRWLLKLHGSIYRPEELVITKQDYIRFADRFAALSGIVQSMLLTRHLLFVGFSFDDDNFQRIFDSVRKARLPKPIRSKNGILGSVKEVYHAVMNGDKEDVDVAAVCGTAIMLEHSYLKEELWDGDISMVFLQTPNEKRESIHELARKQEILLDVLTGECAQRGTTKFLMKDRFRHALSPGEEEMKGFLGRVMDETRRLSPDAKATRAFELLRKTLSDLGCHV